MAFKQASVLPGFNLSFGYTIFYMSLIVLLPLTALVVKTSSLEWGQFWAIVSEERVVATYKVTFGASLLAAIINLFTGLLVAWVLVRYSFPGKRLIDALVDLPFALPTAVAGIALATIYAPNGWIGQWFAPGSVLGGLFGSEGLSLAFNPTGIVIALTFVTLPFVVRTVQPVLADIEQELEEAASSLGANRWQIFRLVILPILWPALLTGFSLAFARAIGEYGSVIFIAGNMPFKSEITPLMIISKLEQYDYVGATAIAVVMLGVSFLLLLAINGLQWWSARRLGRRN
ncbi:sulfate ABC transporter permease subunit CysT [Chitinilyticum litopenaei]|uniref:sulfate ABC transporter permease subunit CysT n=1 Tax=Chitinilyticum litopenaei TaxID=1121276 RepID=UPI0003FD24B7|nr:sulfate ABC transporter permease subunit CysT [Chitinilyticum litopenaei]